jgi:hypothetical protein
MPLNVHTPNHIVAYDAIRLASKSPPSTESVRISLGLSQTREVIGQIGWNEVFWIGEHIRHLRQDAFKTIRRDAACPAHWQGAPRPL